MRVKIEKVVRYINLPRHMCDHLLNKKHTKSHRMGMGMIVMVIGVIIAKSAGGIHIMILHIIGDVIGYALHGLGAMPIIEHLVEIEEEEETPKT